MASLGITLDSKDLPDGQNFEPIPEGWYVSEIKKADLKPTSSGGKMIGVDYRIEGPTHAGRLINFQNINIQNANPTAEEIGKGQLKQIMGAIGLVSIQDTDQLVGGRLMIKVVYKPESKYKKDGVEKISPAGNEVKGWKALEGSAPPMPTAKAPAASTGSTAPWAKPATTQ